MPLGGLLVAGIATGASALFGLGKAAVGASRAKKARRALNKHKFPKYKIPPELKQKLELNKRMAEAGLPGRDLILDQMGAQAGASLAATRKGATSIQDLLFAQNDIYGRQLTETRNLGIQAAQYQAQRQDVYGQSLSEMGGYRDQQFNINQYQPSQFRAGLKQSDYQMGVQQRSQGWNQFGSALNTAAGVFGQAAALRGMYPQPGGGAPNLNQPTPYNVGAQGVPYGTLPTGGFNQPYQFGQQGYQMGQGALTTPKIGQ